MRSGHHHIHFLSVLGLVLFFGLFFYKVFFVNDFFGRLLGTDTTDRILVLPDTKHSGNLKQVLIRYPDGRKVSFEVAGTVKVEDSFLKVISKGKSVVYWLPKGTKVYVREED